MTEVRVTTDNVEVGIGRSATLTCNVVGENQREFTYSWAHEGTQLATETSAVFIIPSFSLKDAGTYTCEAENLDGDGRGSISIGLGGI